MLNTQKIEFIGN